MDLGLADKVVFITGASGGIGRALARVFAAEGAALALHGHASFDALCAWLAEQPFAERALALQADVTDPGELERAFDATRARFGRVDVCVANAGIWPPDDVPLVALDDARARRTIEVNLLGALWTARAFLRALQATGPRADGHGAALLFTGSTAARFGERGHADYATAKAGLYGLAQSLKNELVALDPYGRVNIVEPGWTVTEMTRRAIDDPAVVAKVVRTMPLHQLARAEDIALAAAWLASPRAARHISGTALTVAGGMEGRVLAEAETISGEAVLGRLRAD
ncbi:MAG: SDR family oxidoreductase [Planctomycetota bacterium]